PAPSSPPKASEENNAALAAAYQIRAKAPRVEVPAERAPQGEVRVNLLPLMLQPNEFLLVEGDPRLHCLRGYRTDQKRLDEMRARYRDSILCRLSDGYLALPPALAATYIGEEKRLLALALENPEGDCIELWTLPAWHSLERRFGNAFMLSPDLRRWGAYLTEIWLVVARGRRISA
ncbi:MAG: hypothetical protein N3A66_04145, partial [Planctomycetota bacterium]|nr:hypothetical protein [Planctomycetota bacterium]